MNHNNGSLVNPPSFLNAELFNVVDVPNNNTSDLFADLSWLDNSSLPTRPLTPPLSPQPQIPPPLPHPPQLPQPSITETVPNTIPSSQDSIKRDIMRHIYNTGNLSYLKSSIPNIETFDLTPDEVLFKKFSLGIFLDSALGLHTSEQALANFIFVFFETIFEEAQKFSPPDIKKYIDVFYLSLKKEKINISQDSGNSTIAKIIAASDTESLLQSLQNTDSPSQRALKASLQNVSLLICVSLLKKILSPSVLSLIGVYEQNKETNGPVTKKQKLQ